LTSPMPLRAQLLQTQRDNLPELLEALSPDDEATLSLAMRVAVPLLDELTNVAINKPPPNVSAPRQASVRAWSPRWLSSSPANADCTSTVVSYASCPASPRSAEVFPAR
jgi:hypothetical protein